MSETCEEKEMEWYMNQYEKRRKEMGERTMEGILC